VIELTSFYATFDKSKSTIEGAWIVPQQYLTCVLLYYSEHLNIQSTLISCAGLILEH
jgi:hypothetical protein